MNQRVSFVPRSNSGIGFLALLTSVLSCSALFTPALQAQSSLQLFGPVNQRASATGTGYGAAAVNFNSTTLNLTCSTTPITAVLSSTPDSTGKLLVDNNINVSVTAGGTTTGPTNVCVGGVNGSAIGIPFQNCFSSAYEFPPAGVNYFGEDPDNFVSTGGVPPFSIASLLVPGTEQVTIALQDEGFDLASSTLYLNTNCTQNGVTGPALVTGNPLTSGNPPPGQVTQDFSFNSIDNQNIGFEYDLSAALSAGDLTIVPGTIPQVADSPLDPSIFQSKYVLNTSFSTSNCLVHSGEVLANGNPACKLYTLECKIGTGATASGAQCPVSAEANEIFQDSFNGPAFALSDIVTPNGTFHEGMGLLMANEAWGGGPCTFDAEADLGNLNCPQNLLTSFTSSDVSSDVRKSRLNGPLAALKPETALSSGPHANIAGAAASTSLSTGSTTRPNSTFISVAQVPEDKTTITVAGSHPGGWINQTTADVTFSSEPPNLSGSTIPGAAAFVPSPIQSITYGISPAASVPVAGSPVPGDVTLTNSEGCPTPPNLTTPPATTFTPDQQSLTGLTNGYYLVHYFAQDCAGTEELHFTKDSNGFWSTSFYTFQINVDTVPPVVASGPTLTSGTYSVGQSALASYSCTDALSGIVTCGAHTYAPGATNNTGTVTSLIDTASPGTKTFTVRAFDAAHNTASASVSYQVVSGFDSKLQVLLASPSVSFPASDLVTVKTLPGVSPLHRATGSVTLILNGTTTLGTLTLGGAGNGFSSAYYNLTGLNKGQYGVTAVYAGDAFNPGGTSAPALLTVLPAPVSLLVSCVNPSIEFGLGFSCNIYTKPVAAGATGAITYSLDGGTPVSVTLSSGTANFIIPTPSVGPHSVVVSYAAQGNYAAAPSQTVNFKVFPVATEMGAVHLPLTEEQVPSKK